ncbi:hypothetical protein MWU58_11215 [Flavobacteriaceae bacterium S0825]|uniref:hypothetical protein n=1 Tax=Gaetbulibacter sp. S0825 TaxID=2720084 RepID=UPI0014315950|nr:hypothetical protein [Gaetbulibacter sp. S0825]MCK0109865.1 hypothetical protein [Flavobacteriaceae bacterium S0825]NIX65494.1 hypothetical protein [Gaetbulibacter sp. S0825]
MKTALLYRALITLILMPSLVLANNNDLNGKHTKEKKVHKEFSVSADATLEVDNSYGNIDIVTWNENRIVIDVTITTNGNNLEKVEKKLKDINIEFSGSSSRVIAKTRFSKSKSFWNWGNNNVSMKINYVIKMPMSNNVDLENDYGSINLDKLEGRATIDCDYGKITTKELMADNNDISFDYTKNSYFEYIKSGVINADYSSYTVGKTNDLEIDADYTKSTIEIAEDVSYNCDYGSLTIGKANNIKGDGDYLTLRIGEVYKNVSVTADYGSMKIDNMTSNAGDVNIESDYMKITIGYSSGYSFDFDLDLSYASLRGDDDLEVSKRIEKSSSKKYSGYHGSKGSGNTINITSDYGSVTFKKN